MGVGGVVNRACRVLEQACNAQGVYFWCLTRAVGALRNRGVFLEKKPTEPCHNRKETLQHTHLLLSKCTAVVCQAH